MAKSARNPNLLVEFNKIAKRVAALERRSNVVTGSIPVVSDPYTAGFGLDLVTNQFSVDPTEITLDQWATPTSDIDMDGWKFTDVGAASNPGEVVIYEQIPDTLAVSRATSVETTASLANNANSTADFTLTKGYKIISVTADRACRVRLYATSTDRTADASRAIGTDPIGDHGVMLDLVIPASILTWRLTPQVHGNDLEGSPDGEIACIITNMSGATSTVQVTITYQETEQ